MKYITTLSYEIILEARSLSDEYDDTKFDLVAQLFAFGRTSVGSLFIPVLSVRCNTVNLLDFEYVPSSVPHSFNLCCKNANR